MTWLKYVLAVLLVLSSFFSNGQVGNNKIENRITLKLDSGWYSSSTSHSTVEWDCINQALANKCLIYHNDQWFTFKPDHPGPLFINVSNQQCKTNMVFNWSSSKVIPVRQILTC